MKRIIFSLALCLGFFSLSAQDILLDKVVGVIGDQAILLSEIEEQYALMSERQGVVPDEAKCFIFDQLLTQNLLVVQAELDSLVIAEEEIEAQLDARISQILQYMNGSIEQFMDYYGKTPDEVKEEFRDDLRNQILAQRKQQEVLAQVKVTPSEVVAFFGRIPKDSLPYFGSEVEVGEITISPVANKAERQRAVDTLTSIRDRIVNEGADFAELAIKYSEDPGTGRRGGDLGWTKRGDFVPEFEAEAYNLEKGDISSIVKSEFGYHLIQLLDRKGNRINTRHILIIPDIIPSDLEDTRLKLDTIANLVKTDSISFQKAVARYSDENSQSKTNAGIIVNQKTSNSFFEIKDLPVEVFFAIDSMDVGQISSPIKFEDIQTGEVTYKALLLISRTEPHTANLQDDYSKIQTATLEQKKAQYMSEWVVKNRNRTYVRIDNMFSSRCEELNKWTDEDKKRFR